MGQISQPIIADGYQKRKINNGDFCSNERWNLHLNIKSEQKSTSVLMDWFL